MDEYLDDLKAGKIVFRDKWQFELKTELFPFQALKQNVQTQEFYFFIPNSLQINEHTYTKTQFYLGQTNLVRFKTPAFTFKQLIDPDNSESPLVRILMLADYAQSPSNTEEIQNELKLLGNIFHSALREKMVEFVNQLEQPESKEQFTSDFNAFCDELEEFRSRFSELQDKFLRLWSSPVLSSEFEYIDEFISLTIHDYFSGFLNRLRNRSRKEFAPIDQRLCEIIGKEKEYRENKFPEDPYTDEYMLYRKALLNKFMIDPLLLKTNRFPVERRFRGLILGIPAAIAMTIFLLLYVWQGNVFLLNSQPFVLLTVIIYVLKDRLKEELRSLSYRQAAKWFSDYTTEIRTQQNDTLLGYLYESFSFVSRNKVPAEILDIRHLEFHSILETFERPEQIIYYKKTIKIKEKPKMLESRFYGFSTIFRFDIHHFLSKAEDPYQMYLDLDPETLALRKTMLPRVYHLNIIMKTTLATPGGKSKVELKKFRLVVDKNGIKRVEHFS